MSTETIRAWCACYEVCYCTSVELELDAVPLRCPSHDNPRIGSVEPVSMEPARPLGLLTNDEAKALPTRQHVESAVPQRSPIGVSR